MEPSTTYGRRCGHRRHGIFPALVVIAIGVLFFLSNLNILPLRDITRYWPVLLIFAGVYRLLNSAHGVGRVAGGVLISLGAIFLASNLGYLPLRPRDFWPLILIGIGVLMLFNRILGKSHRAHGWQQDISSAGTMHERVVFSGLKRIVSSQDFQGGYLKTVFGGIELDLRQAGMAADSAVLEIDAVFGGAEIRIPPNWSAVVQGSGVVGAFSDETTHPDPNAPGVKKLIVTGSAVVGGVAVKN
jgi:hypothetical protein